MKKCIVLVSNQSFSAENKSNTASLNALLDAKKIKRDEVDGSAEDMVDRRNALFGISGVRGSYPQVFLVDEGETTPRFIGLFDAIHDMNEMNDLPTDIIEQNNILTFDAVFADVERMG
ncbi:hypothetical protein SPRG_09432 [Saprolegnia parasitica CBS 223.65]|uniref:Glutaredoxin domain-containing protein n=1 Tax=Saprolegnia parasitica (strain CBS 223.65) TaxID=695850 RepID=A0A067C3W5_SAPPC|nr:hypothetical protein SPRG_09432 [Saprolegnia parasitica CBS 223.65]KDO25489.1 hypothetical protein SPRG_09432 [Saprolegnia parasitica CBS 223.65]|eukprot:XP_012203914.1 hypothetical protein SPRG_09432 [Saprolegnia parasitica CBS 223.65]